MPSPFPGMNPYLEHEDAWHDFHERFIPAVAEAIGPQVRPAYIVKIDQHLYIHELPADERRLVGRSDVSIARSPDAAAAPRTAVLEDPMEIVLPAVDWERHAFIEIRDRDSRDVVTVVELLSPSNKNPGSDREQYLGKRAHALRSRAHLVEIDLLRGGPRMPHIAVPDGDYCVVVSRTERRPRIGVWPVRLRDRLPVVPIPLRAPDPDARLDLQAVLHRVYDAAGYQDYVYAHPPQPPLRPEDADWARQFLPTR
jgi:uncharacterized protein DUF4058